MNNNKSFRTWILINICVSIFFFSCNDVEKNDGIENQNSNWTTSLIDAYRALDKNRNIESADLLFKASDSMPNKNWENYLIVATIYASNQKNNKAFNALERALEAGLKDPELLNSLPDLSLLHNDSRWKTVVSKANENREVYLKTIENLPLLESLEKMWLLDQQALSEYEQNLELLDSTATNEDYSRLFTPVENRWEINKQKLDSIINIHGWPGYRLVGETGAKIGWAIPQHHPDVFFKQKCLSLIKEAVEKGDTNPNHYAELHDRIARETWQKQMYGASMGNDAPYPIEDPANVDKRRSDIGLLEPIEVYAYYHGITYQRPSIEKAKLTLKAERDKAQKNYKKFEQLLGERQLDSANIYLRKAIKAFGDLSNDQLYQASMKLAQVNYSQSEEISIKIIKVLIWRKWEGRHDILNNDAFISLQNNTEWNNIGELLQRSK